MQQQLSRNNSVPPPLPPPEPDDFLELVIKLLTKSKSKRLVRLSVVVSVVFTVIAVVAATTLIVADYPGKIELHFPGGRIELDGTPFDGDTANSDTKP